MTPIYTFTTNLHFCYHSSFHISSFSFAWQKLRKGDRSTKLRHRFSTLVLTKLVIYLAISLWRNIAAEVITCKDSCIHCRRHYNIPQRKSTVTCNFAPDCHPGDMTSSWVKFHFRVKLKKKKKIGLGSQVDPA